LNKVIYLRKIIINIYIMDKKIEKNRLLTRIRMKRYRTARTIFYSRPESHGRYVYYTNKI